MAKRLIFGGLLAIIAVIGLIIVLILTIALPWGFWMGAKSADKEYDDWFNSARTGDEITVSGTIEKEEDALTYGLNGFLYTFEGCDNEFYSKKDIASEGERIIVFIEVDGSTGPTVSRSFNQQTTIGPNVCCCCLTGTLFLFGGIIALTGLAKGKKKNKTPKKKDTEE